MSKTKPFVITVDMENEYQDYQTEEPDVSTQGKVLGHVDDGQLAIRIAKWLLVARELKQAAEGILRPSKVELIAGATHDLELFLHRQKDTYQFGDHEIRVPRYTSTQVGRPPLPPSPENELDTDIEWEEPGHYVRTTTPEAADTAEQHLDGYVMTNLQNRLAIIRLVKGKDAMVAKAESWFAEARKMVSELAENGD